MGLVGDDLSNVGGAMMWRKIENIHGFVVPKVLYQRRGYRYCTGGTCAGPIHTIHYVISPRNTIAIAPFDPRMIVYGGMLDAWMSAGCPPNKQFNV